MEHAPQMLRRWGHFHRSYTQREKEDWEKDFARAEAAAPPPPPPPGPMLVPPPKPPKATPMKDPAEVFATVRRRLESL